MIALENILDMAVRFPNDRISSVSPSRARPADAWIKWRQSKELGL